MMKKTKCSLLILIFFLGAVLPANVYSEEDSDGALQVTNLGKIIIGSDSFNWKTKEKIIVFSENVTAQIEEEDLTIECDEIHVYYSESENGDNNPDKLLATGNVSFTHADDVSGTGEEAVYDLVEETVTLTGQPVLKQRKNTLKGSSLTYHVSDGSISGTDVNAVLYLEEEGVSTGGQ